jgi:hypothetical protein
MFNGSVILPDNSVIEAADIREIPYYQEGLEKFLNEGDDNTLEGAPNDALEETIEEQNENNNE